MIFCEFFVPGEPATSGSKRGFPIKRKNGTIGVAMAPDNKRAKPWMAAVASEASQHVSEITREPCLLSVTLVFTRPKSHYGTGKNIDVLKRSAPSHHTKKPDSLKCVRAIEDALSGVVWADDSQVVGHEIEKRYGDQAGAFIRIEKVT